MLPQEFSMSETEKELIAVVDDTLSQNYPGTNRMREQLEAVVQNSGIAIVARKG